MPRRKQVNPNQEQGPTKRQTGKNTLDSKLALSINEKLLRLINDLYNDKETGIGNIGNNIGLHNVSSPPNKITVLICGNHSSGKSSFINWYIDEHVQKTGVAIETNKFTCITSGKKRDTLQGPTSLVYWKKFKAIEKFEGMPDYLETEVCVSTARKFPMVTFIDTPGLVDGQFHYPFPVEDIICYLASHSDLIFVFFDPMGQALCKRTMNIIERLNKEKHGDKIRYYLSKSDEFDSDGDRSKVLIQITQNLTSTLKSGTNFDLPTIYLPREGKDQKGPNAINEVCHEIEKTINQSVQTALNNLEIHCKEISSKIDSIIAEEEKKKKANARARIKTIIYTMLALMIPIFWLLYISSNYLTQYTQLEEFFQAVNTAAKVLPMEYRSTTFWVSFGIFFLFLLFVKVNWKRHPTIANKRLSQLKEWQKFVKTTVMEKKQDLFLQFFKQIDSSFQLD